MQRKPTAYVGNAAKKIHFAAPTPLIGQVSLSCTHRAATVHKETINAKSDLFQQITTSDVAERPKKEHRARGAEGFILELRYARTRGTER